MATVVGKALVIINAVLSLGLAAMALGIYTNHIDWPGVRPATVGGEKSQSQYTVAKQQNDEAQKAAGLALARWEEASRVLQHLEERLPNDQALYAKRLDILNGRDKDGNVVDVPIQMLVTKFKGGQPPVDEDGIEALRWEPINPPLLSRRALLEQMDRTEAETRAAMAAVEELIRKQENQTIEINGVPGKQKGLRDLLGEETATIRNTLAELEYLKPLRYNYQADLDLLQKRQLALRTRIQEIKGPGMAFRR
jgi:hypothetical protein